MVTLIYYPLLREPIVSLVTVVVTTYYRNERLRAALSSVVDQTHAPIETIVVDCSGEGHARPVAAEFPCRYVGRDAEFGPHEARSIGAERAAGRYVQFLDDDDVLHPEKIARQLRVFRSTDDVGVVHCGRVTESGARESPRPALRGDVLDRFLAFDGVPCLTSTMVLDAAVLDEILPLQNRHAADDLGMRIELASRTRFDYVDDVLVTAGESEDARGRSWAAIEAKRHLLDRYADLYEQFPAAIRREALADVYRRAGRRHLEDSLWTPRAPYCFALSLWFEPQVEALHLGELLTSVLGRPGRHLGALLKG